MFSARTLATPIARTVLWPQTGRILVTKSRTFATMPTLCAPALTDAITSDHRDLERYYKEIVNSNDVDHQARYGNQFTWELARHSVAEELIVYPAMEEYMDDGKARADKDRDQHHTLKELLKEFQNMNADDPKYVPQLKRLYLNLQEHIKEEENDDLPALERALAKDEYRDSSERLVRSFSRTKKIAPSRAHPAAGEDPFVEGVAGPAVAIFDRIADLFRRFPEDKTTSPDPVRTTDRDRRPADHGLLGKDRDLLGTDRDPLVKDRDPLGKDVNLLGKDRRPLRKDRV